MKIAILGTENSHAYAFSKRLREDRKYADVELIGVYGFDEEANRKLLNEGLAPYAASSPDEFLGKVDGILVTARHGDLHYDYAMPYLRKGVPAFIDKPFTVDPAKAMEMLKVAKANGAPLCGGSLLKYPDEFAILRRFIASRTPIGGYVTAPIHMQSPYGGFYFYAQHLVECMFSVFGPNVKSVCARCPDEAQDRVSVIFNYGDFDVTGQYTCAYVYTALALCKEGCLSMTPGDMGYCYNRELDEFVEMVQTGKMAEDYDALVRPSLVLPYIEEAYRTGKEVRIPE